MEDPNVKFVDFVLETRAMVSAAITMISHRGDPDHAVNDLARLMLEEEESDLSVQGNRPGEQFIDWKSLEIMLRNSLQRAIEYLDKCET